MKSGISGAVRVTQEMVARHCGVSRSAVRDILGQKGHLFHPGTCDRVRRTAAELGYRPHGFAKALRSGRTQQIGVLVRNDPSHPLAYPAAYEMIQGINQELESSDYSLTLVRLVDVRKPAEHLPRVLREHLLDGMIVIDSLDESVFEHVPSMRERSVFLESNVWKACGCVRRDERHACRLAVSHLVAAGYRDLVYLTADLQPRSASDTVHFSVIERLEGVRQEARDAGARVDVRYWTMDPSVTERPWVPDDLEREMIRPGVGIILYGAHAAPAVARAAKDMFGLEVGRDFGLVSLDETHEVRMMMPWLSRVGNDRFLLGQRAAQMMAGLLSGRSRKEASVRIQDSWCAGDTVREPTVP